MNIYILEEYCKKNNISKPIFLSNYHEKNNKTYWKSKVIIGELSSSTQTLFVDKISAENYVAMIIMDVINNNHSVKKIEF